MRNPSGLIGLVILVIAIFIALFGPMIFPTSPWRVVQRPFIPPLTLPHLWLGTDALGRDVFAGIIYGARVSLLVGLVSTLVALAVGVPLGAVAGYFGGRIDDALMRFTEFFQTIPSFALAIVLVAILQPSIYSIIGVDRDRELAAGGAAGARRSAVVAHPRICPGRRCDRTNHMAGSSGAKSCPTRCRRSSCWHR